MNNSLYRTLFGPQRGTAILELALVIPLLFMLFVGLLDFSFICREKAVVTEVIRTTSRLVLVTPDFESPRAGDEQVQRTTYTEDRYTRALYLARYLINENGLDANNYNFNLINVEKTEANYNQTFEYLRLSISSRTDGNRFFFLPETSIFLCVKHDSIIAGETQGPGFRVVEPEFDSVCNNDIGT